MHTLTEHRHKWIHVRASHVSTFLIYPVNSKDMKTVTATHCE